MIQAGMVRSRLTPAFLSARGNPSFPDPRLADESGMLAIGGELTPERLRLAYDNGIFPWYDEGLPPMWWSPDPRALLDPSRLIVTRSMRRVLARGGFAITANRAFSQVIRACAANRPEGTWLIGEMIQAYTALHELGDAHSFEVWKGEELVGGLYGVQRGALFAAESMFHTHTNASKVALILAVQLLFEAGIELFEVQFLTEHLASLGAYEVSREDYLTRLARARAKPVRLRPDLIA